MPTEETLHNRYSRALFDIAREERKLKEVMEELSFFNEKLLKDKKIHNLLINPLISRHEKKGIINEILKNINAGYPLDNFLYLLIDDHREELLHGIFLSYKDLYQLEKNYTYVYVETASEISSHEMYLLKEALKKKLKQEVEIEVTINPKILGGIYIRWQNLIYDDTVHEKLISLKGL